METFIITEDQLEARIERKSIMEVEGVDESEIQRVLAEYYGENGERV